MFDLATKNTLFLSVFSDSHSLNTGMVTRHFHGAGMDDHTQNVQIGIAYIHRHRENFWAFTGPKTDFGWILLILNMIIHRSFTGPSTVLLIFYQQMS